MTDPYFLQSLSLSGFRAYLEPKTFDFSKKRCLGVQSRHLVDRVEDESIRL